MDARDVIAEALGNVKCGCGHELRRHDPAAARCDSPSVRGLGQCPCICAHSPDPDRTLDEVRVDALAADGYVIVRREQVGWLWPDGLVPMDATKRHTGVPRARDWRHIYVDVIEEPS